MSKLSKGSKTPKDKDKKVSSPFFDISNNFFLQKTDKDGDRSSKAGEKGKGGKKGAMNETFKKNLLGVVHDSLDSVRFKNFRLEEQEFRGGFEAVCDTIDTLVDGVFEYIKKVEQDGKKVPYAAEYTLNITDICLSNFLAIRDQKMDDKYLDLPDEPAQPIIDGSVKDVIKTNAQRNPAFSKERKQDKESAPFSKIVLAKAMHRKSSNLKRKSQVAKQQSKKISEKAILKVKDDNGEDSIQMAASISFNKIGLATYNDTI